MRKIEEKMVQAVNEARNFYESNTQVVTCGNVIRVYLFGNMIFEKNGNKKTYYHCGWPTVTTASRLRALGAEIEFKRGKYIKFL